MSENIFFNPDVPATIINMALVREYGGEWYSWEPETIKSEIEEDFNLEEPLDSITSDKIQAVSTLVLTDSFYTEWEMFENICKAFNDQLVMFDERTNLTAEECTWGIIEAHLNDDRPRKFSAEVKEYIKTVYRVEGLVKQPSIIECVFDEYVVTPPSYDKDIQKIKQARIRAYIGLQINEIKNYSSKYFNLDIAPDIKKDFPKIDI